MNTKTIILGVAAVAAECAVATLQPMPKGELPDPAGLAINAGRKIAFAHPLPRMRCGRAACGTYNNWELAFPGLLTTAGADFGNALWDLRKVVWADRRLVFVDGRTLMCQLNWIRDHVHQMKGYRHWEHDLTSFLDFILDTQRADGQFYELIKQLDDFHWTFVPPDCRILYPEDNQSLVRLELEADIEYLMVEGCLQAWRVTGDDDWLRRALPRLEKGIDYMTSSPKRWDKAHGLCMRPYTIDTWDFTNDPLSGSNRSVILSEPMAIMHGDNSGVYQAMNQLAWINDRFGNAAKASEWRERAATLKANMFKHLWNGTFFCHQLPLNCEPLDAHEKKRLSLSMAYALNRGLLTLEQKRGVVAEYKTRRNTTKGFSEWFTIDPAYYPAFKGNPPGRYVNGALSPFTAGELAKGAFECGEEAYGWDILNRVAKMVKRDDGKLYFLYDPISGKPQGGGPSAWGAAAILAAVDEGLAGVQDLDAQYRAIRFAPRWAVTPFDEGRYLTGYEASHKTVDVRWIFTDKGFRYHLRSPAKKVSAHLLVPSGKVPDTLYVNGEQVPFSLVTVGDSRYVDADVSPQAGIADFEVLYLEEAWFGARIPTSGEDGREDCGMTAARVFDAPIAGLERIGTLDVPKSADLPESSNASIGFECLDRGLFDPDRCYDTLAAAGVKWARCQTMWSRCEKQKGIYDFTVLDSVVDNLTRRGIRPWFSVTFGNTLYMTNCFTGAAVGCVPTLYGDACRAAWCAYVRALAKRYKGKVTHWEIWNEPNIPQFWQPSKPNAAEYLELVKLTGGIIREEIPDAKIGGTTCSPALNKWETDFFELGGASAIDFWCSHAYARVPERLRKQQRIASGSSADYVTVLKDVRAFIDAHGGKHVEIWQGESGFPSWFPAGHWLWWPKSVCKEGWQSQANQAKWLLRRFVTDRRAGIARSSFFQMADISRHYSMALTTQTHPAEHGIVNGWTYRPKMSCHAFGHYNALLATARHDDSIAVSVTPDSDADAPTVATTFRAASGAPLFIYYTAFDFSGAYTGTCYTARCDAKLAVPVALAPKDPVLVDMLRGGVYAVRGEATTSAALPKVVTYEGLPLVDYPLVLCDRSAVKFRRKEFLVCGVAAAVAGAATALPRARLYVVQDVDGYNSWPMIQASGGRLVCAYGRGKGHWVEGSRGAYVRTSSDGGLTWSPEVCIANDPVICEGVEGSGRDAGGAMLFWMNCRGRGHIRHELYRTADGVSFERISAPEMSPEPIQVTGIFSVPEVGLMSLWFAGNYRSGEPCNSWGTLVSTDGGKTWTQRTVEKNLTKKEWPTEICAVALGGGRILAIGRSEGDVKRQFQLTSLDGGATWRKAGTNIRDVWESTPSLIYDGEMGTVSHYYYQRGPGIMWRRTAKVADVFDRPESWPAPVQVARGGRKRPYDSGNVTSVAMGDSHYLAYYSGDPTNTAVLVACVPARPGMAARRPEDLVTALILPSGRLVSRGMICGARGTVAACPDEQIVDDAGAAVAAFEGGARRIRSNDPVKLWNAIVPLVDAMNGEQAGNDIIHRQ